MQARAYYASAVALAACVASSAWARPAAANGRFPQASQIVFSPSDPLTVVMRTTFGLLVSHDGGGSWQWICEAAIGLGGAQEDPCYGVTQAGTIVGGLWQGLAVSPDTGCNWAFAGGGLAGQVMVDLVVRPDDPHVVLAVTGTWIKNATSLDGASGNSYDSQVFRSADDGAHWSALGVALDPTARLTTIEVAKSDPHRLYASGTRGSDADRTAQLFVSSDDGASWTERVIPLIAGVESAAYIGAVDPTNADVVYVRTDVHSRLLVTSDAGKSFTVASFIGADGGAADALNGYMFGFALSADGAKIYAGGVGDDGLFVGARGSSTLVRRSGIHVECLASRGAEVWACSDEASGFLTGVSTDDGATFAPMLHLAGVDGVLRCAAGATVAQCEAQYAAQCTRLGGCETSDAGPVDAGSDAGPPPGDVGPATTSAGAPGTRAGAPGGCSAGGGGGSAGFVAVSAAALGMLWRKRRCRKTRG